MFSRFYVLSFLLLAFFLFILPTQTQAATFVVDRGDDSASATACTAAANDCSLRGAITASNTGGDVVNTINFNIPGSGVHTINVLSPLPALKGSVTINGATQSGYFGTPLIELNGAGAGFGTDGILITGISNLSTTFAIYALAINRFRGNGINFNCGTEQNCKLTLLGNFIGTNPEGTTDLGNTGVGVRLKLTPLGDCQIGGTGIFEGNVISGNFHDGIFITAPDNIGSTTDVTIQGNKIGTNFDGTADLGNTDNGIYIGSIDFDNDINVYIGGTTSNARNIISGNDRNGIEVNGYTTNIITGNYIGTNAAGTADLGNGFSGIKLPEGVSTIGGTVSGAGNLISGNNIHGIHVDGGYAKIRGNQIGINAAGTAALGNTQNGIYVFKDGGDEIGSETANDTVGGNLISGNSADGIKLEEATSIKVFNNKIGTNLAGNAKIPNQNDGIEIKNVDTNFTFNGEHQIKKNVISGNLANGININGVDSILNIVESNFIGTNSNSDNLGNSGRGVYITASSSQNIIGGTNANTGNIIAFNGDDGIGIDGGTKNAVRQNSIYSNTGLGIDLETSGVTANDQSDADSGANDLQNFPVLSVVTPNLIFGILNSTANTNFTIEFYRVDSCDASGNGEGRYYLGSTNISTPSNGNDVSFNVTTIPLTLGQIITATATDANGNTSEFSQCKTISPPQGNLTFSAANYTVNEGTGTRTIVVNRNGGTFGTISVDYAVTDGTATAPADFTAVSGTLTFNNGEVVKTFDVQINTTDTMDEPDETINLTLSNPSTGVNLTPNPTAVLTIQDNDNPPTISITDVSQTEGNIATSAFLFNVSLSAPSGFPITVDFATTDGTATVLSDYLFYNGIATFNAGETSKQILVAVNGDLTPELDETFFINLSNPTNASIADNQAVGTILDDDNPGKFSFSFAPYSGTEHDSVLVTVSRTNGTAGTVSVDYATSGGTAQPFSDYTPVSGTLIFGDGETTKTFSISLGDDSTPEPVETVNLVLSNPIGGASLGSLSVAVLNIIDNDNGTLLQLAGEVKLSDNTPVANVKMTLQGTQTATTQTDSLGRYSFANLAPNGNYTVTPSAIGYTFNPISQQFNNLTTDDLNVNFTATVAPSRQLRVIGGDTKPTQSVNVVVELVAQGDENSVGFSLNYDSAILSNPNVVLSSDATAAFLTVNNSQSGKVGILLALPAGQSFTVGTKSLITITFNTAATNAYISPVTFGDAPLARGVSSINADDLQASFLDGQVTFSQGYEADTAPRPTGTGNGSVTVADFTQIGRFVAGLNTPDQLNEFQRADCAPRVSLGNGVLSVSDYTQAGRYAAGLDVVNPSGGPTSQSFAALDFDGNKIIGKDVENSNALPRILRVVNSIASPGTQVFVSIEVDSNGDENGFGFSLSYDSSKLSNPLVQKGSDTQTATLFANTNQNGKVGVVLALPAGQMLTTGVRQIVTIRFDVAANAPGGNTPLTFSDAPVFREVVDANADTLTTTFQDGQITIASPTSSSVSVSGKVTTASGKGINRAVVSITDSNGALRIVLTNPFGYYRFEEILVGETYIINVNHKRYQFNPSSQVLTISEDRENVNFIAQE